MRFPVADGWRAVFGAQFVSRISKLNTEGLGINRKCRALRVATE